MQDRYKLLLAEGWPSEARLIVRELGRAGLDVDCERVVTAAHLEAALETKRWDFIIYAEHLPDLDWTAALSICRQKGLDIPFIMVSGTHDEDPAVQRIQAGVHEHVLKDSLARLPHAVRREMRSAQERRIRNHAEATSRFIMTSFGCSGVAVIGEAFDGTVLRWDAAAEGLSGYSASEMIGRSISVLLPLKDLGETLSLLERRGGGEQERCLETICFRKNGSQVRVQMVPWPVEDTAGRVIGASIMVREFSESEEWPWLDPGAFAVGMASPSTDQRLTNDQ